MQVSANITDAGVATARVAVEVPITSQNAGMPSRRKTVPFSIALQRAVESGVEAARQHARTEEARETARQLVAALFYEPMLAEMRQFPFGEKFSSGGRGEEVFGEQLDQLTAAAVSSSQHGGLIDLIAADIAGDRGAWAQAARSAPDASAVADDTDATGRKRPDDIDTTGRTRPEYTG
jgi:Rod binding domain-containing protein